MGEYAAYAGHSKFAAEGAVSTRAGFAKAEITAWEPELAMMGWGRMDNRIVGVAEPLFARTMAMEVGEARFYFVCIELMAVSHAIRDEVLARLDRDHAELGIGSRDVMMTATHTHSGPSGYSHYFFINLNGPGFSPTVFEAAVKGTVDSIVAAHHRLRECELELARGEMPLKEAVAFNRSWFAYNENEDVEPVNEQTRDEAVDRDMTVLLARSEGRAYGCISWFPVHCTSVHAENDRLHSDNKGLASADLEREMGDDFVAIFAQEASGDVSPNFRYDAARRKVIGKYDDDYKSAQFNADAQRRLTTNLIRDAEAPTWDAIETNAADIDFSAIEVSSKFSRIQGATTTTGTLGISMAEGTDEGPGPILRLRRINRWLTRRNLKKGVVDPKIPMIDVGSGLDASFLGRFSVRDFRIPRLDPTFAYIKKHVREGRLDEAPWIAQVLRLQVTRVGPLLLVGIPFEASTVAGRRIRELMHRHFDVEHVLVVSYTNGYAGYCTTFEEYRVQHYEAGYTLFGPHQLGGLLTMLDEMARNFPAPIDTDATPWQFDASDIERRRFETPWPVPRARPTWQDH